MYEDYEALKVVSTNKTVTVSFNRPEWKNAINAAVHQELVRIFKDIQRDPDAFVVVLTGEGETFSAGGDIKSMQRAIDDHARWNASVIEAREILYAMVDLDRPIIAKINGHAVGLGATLALFCDLVIALDTAKIADPHVRIGLVAGDGGSVVWPALVGYAKAKRYLLTGVPITGSEAERIGLVTEALPAADLDRRVDELANEIASLPPMALRLTKKAINMDLRQRLDRLIEAHLGFETMSHLSKDHHEAVDAFAERRDPIFTGR